MFQLGMPARSLPHVYAGLEIFRQKFQEVAPFFQSRKSRSEAESALESVSTGTQRTLDLYKESHLGLQKRMAGFKASLLAMGAEDAAIRARLEVLRTAAGDGKVLWQKLEVSKISALVLVKNTGRTDVSSTSKHTGDCRAGSAKAEEHRAGADEGSRRSSR